MRLQTDLEFQLNEIKKLKSTTMKCLVRECVEGKLTQQSRKLRNLKNFYLRAKRCTKPVAHNALTQKSSYVRRRQI